MAKNKVIDGNQIVNDMLAQKAQYDPNIGYGVATDATTGKVLAEVNGQAGQRSAFIPTLEQAGLVPRDQVTGPSEAEEIYAQEEYEGGEGSYGPDFALGSNDQYDDPEFSARKEEYLLDAGNFSNYMEKIGQTPDDIYNGMGGDFSKADMDLFLDARNIKSEDDAIRLGEIHDRWLDLNGLDAEKYYQEGVLEECGPECQERRQMYKAQALEQENDMIAMGDQPMAMSDENFEERYKNMNL